MNKLKLTWFWVSADKGNTLGSNNMVCKQIVISFLNSWRSWGNNENSPIPEWVSWIYMVLTLCVCILRIDVPLGKKVIFVVRKDKLLKEKLIYLKIYLTLTNIIKFVLKPYIHTIIVKILLLVCTKYLKNSLMCININYNCKTREWSGSTIGMMNDPNDH